MERGKRITELFKQAQHSPIPVEVQVVLLWAIQNDVMDDIPVEQISKFAKDFSEHLSVQKKNLLEKILKEKKLDDNLIEEIKSVSKLFRETWKA